MSEKKRPDPDQTEMEQIRRGGTPQRESDGSAGEDDQEPDWLSEDYGEEVK